MHGGGEGVGGSGEPGSASPHVQPEPPSCTEAVPFTAQASEAAHTRQHQTLPAGVRGGTVSVGASGSSSAALASASDACLWVPMLWLPP